MNIRSFKFQINSLLVLTCLLLPLSGMAATHIINVNDNSFSITQLTIAVGDTVTWENAAGGNPHDVTSNTGAWTPSATASSFSFSVTFNSVGTFGYFCTVHTFMTGTITVESAAAAELDLQSVDAVNGSYAPGDMITINIMIMNSGDAGSGALSVSYYASTDTNITSSDLLLGTSDIADVAMNTTLNHQALVNVSQMVPAGDYFIGAILSFVDGNSANDVNHDPDAITFLGLFFINAGLNDAWVSADAPLQGLFFTVFQDIGFFFLSWFTFDSVPPAGEDTAVFGADDQRWVTGGGFYNLDTVTVNVELTSGGIFNASDPRAVQEPGYGTITIVFISCNEAILTYDFPALGLSGQMTLTRVLPDNVPLCEALNAELQIMN